MDEAAKRAGALFGVAQNFRWNRSLEWMREKVFSGQIGDVQMARAEFDYMAQTAPRTWIADPSLACGGPIGDVGVHCVDALRFVLGREVETVGTLARRDALSGEVEAVASMQMEMSGGVFGTVTTSARAAYRTLLEVTGSEGVLVAENGLTVDRPVEVLLRRRGEVEERALIDNGDAYTRMLDEFARAFRGERAGWGVEYAGAGCGVCELEEWATGVGGLDRSGTGLSGVRRPGRRCCAR